MSRRRRGEGVLTVIAGLFVASAVLRAGLGADSLLLPGPAQAEEAAVGPCEGTAPTEALLEAFRQREDRIVEREAQIADRVRALDLAEAEIDEKLAALREAEETLSATLSRASTAAEDDLARLTAVYENMKPDEAAALFAQMSPDFSAGFLARMQPASAALVMAELDPQLAYSISVLIAGRNAGAPTE